MASLLSVKKPYYHLQAMQVVREARMAAKLYRKATEHLLSAAKDVERAGKSMVRVRDQETIKKAKEHMDNAICDAAQKVCSIKVAGRPR